nr:integrase, catalytic region, zinc finger, CCHC-type, peptidase aspartic, catalytic [Tanacetum cinerariifolium]
MQVPLTSEQSTILAQSNTKSTSDSNIISYSNYMNESQYNTVQNSTLPAIQDDLILSVIEQLKTQVVNCTKINQDNTYVNELLTAELDRELALEKQVKELNNIVFKRSQSAQTVHMLTKPLKELFTSFDQCLVDEVTEVQNVFTQMELAVEQHCEEKTKVQTKMENVLQENDRLLIQALSVEIVNIVVHENMKSICLNVTACARCAQAKDTVILKLKEKLNSLNGDVKDRNLKRDVEEIETLNIELDHKVTKLATENKHLKQTYKQLFDSVKSSRVRSKEQCDYLINKVNLKSAEVSDLNASLQEKVLVITALKVQLNKLKGKAVLTEVVSLNPIDPELLKVDVAPLVPKLRKNRIAHTDYIRHTQEEAATLREIVESERLLSPLNTSLVYAWTKLVAVTPKNKTNQIRDTAQVTKSERTTVTTPPSTNLDSNTPMFSSTGVNLVSSASGSMIATPTIVPPREPIPIVNRTDKPVVTLVYSRKPKSKKVSNKMEPNNSLGSSSSNVPSSLPACRLSKSSSDGVDLLTGSRGNNLYTLSMQDMMASSPLCLLSKASKTKSWLWHRRLSHLNIGAINHLSRQAILSGAENRPPMLEKDMYDSWKSRMELYMLNRQHGMMILESVEHGPLLWPSVTEDGVTRLKKYFELSSAEATQADCDVKATNIILQALKNATFEKIKTSIQSLNPKIAYPGRVPMRRRLVKSH